MADDRTLIDDWHVVARSDDMAENSLLPARLLGEDIVLWSGPSGLEVWQDRCPHRGAKLSLGRVSGDRVVCGYHGLEFGAGGACVRYPAHPEAKPSSKAVVRTYAVKERHGLIWVCLGTPANDIPPFPEAEDNSYRIYFGGRFPFETSGPRAIENFLDLSHFPFVHPGLLGQEPHTEVPDYDVAITEDGLVVTNCRAWQPKPTNTLDVDGIEVDYAYYVPRPLTARLTKDIGLRNKAGAREIEAIVLTVTPVEPERSIGWILLASNYDEVYSEAEVAAFTELIIGQDIRIVESQRPKRLPLDPEAEFHLRCDRTSLSYRKWLRELGLTFGTIGGGA